MSKVWALSFSSIDIVGGGEAFIVPFPGRPDLMLKRRSLASYACTTSSMLYFVPPMNLSKSVIAHLQDRASVLSVSIDSFDDDLYQLGILDSFEIVSLISVIERSHAIQIPDELVNFQDFQSINSIARFVTTLSG
jgi:acyl carrier protein